MPPSLSAEAISSERTRLASSLAAAEAMLGSSDSAPNALYALCSTIITDSRQLAAAVPHHSLTHRVEMSHILASAYNYRGVSLIQSGDFHNALGDFTNAIKCHDHFQEHYAAPLAKQGHTYYPDYQAPYKNRIICYEQLGRSAEAAADEKTLATRFSNFEPNWVSDSELQIALAQTPPPERSPSPQAPIYSNDQAASAMLTIPEEPRLPTGEESYLLGEKKLLEERYREALPFFNDAIEQRANLDNAYYRRALCHYKVKSYEQAKSDLNSATQLNPALLHDREVIDAYAAVNAELRKTWMAPLSQPPQPKPQPAAASAARPAPKEWAALPPRPRQHAAAAAPAGHAATIKRTMKDTPLAR